MWKPDEPNGRFGRWGQVASALTTFGILGFVIVFVVLDWLVNSPAWVLWAACIPIALFAIDWGFTTIDDEDLATDVENEDEEELRWVFDRPTGLKGWIVRLAGLSWGFGGLMFLSKMLLVELLGLSEAAWRWSAIPLVALAIALEFLDVEEVDMDGDSSTTPTRGVGGANTRFHERARA